MKILIKHQANKPSYYMNKKLSYYLSQQSKPKMSNSSELLQWSIKDIQKKYEILSDIVTEIGGRVHGSQSHIVQDNSMSLIVYYEVPEGNKREVKTQLFYFISFISLGEGISIYT